MKNLNIYFYLAFVPLHIFGIISLFYLGSVNWIIFLLLWVLIEGYGIQICFHRLLSHKSFVTHRYIRNILSIVGCLGIQGSPIFWAGIHRGYHHRFSDTEKDIHSPVHGNLWSYFIWTIKTDIHKLSFRSVLDLISDPFQVKLNKLYFYIIWFVWILAFIVSPSFFITLVLVQVLSLHSECMVNLFCHKPSLLTYRTFDLQDNSQNIYLLGLLVFGIGYHNNHHRYPARGNFSYSKYEIDTGYWLLRTIGKDINDNR